MNTKVINSIRRALENAVPGVEIEVQLPALKDGFWWIDVKLGEILVVVQYREKQGFGISLVTDQTGYGTAPDFVRGSVNEAVSKTLELFAEAGASGFLRTKNPVKQLREHCGVTQVELAHRLGITQPTLSVMEKRPCSVNRLMQVAHVLGGKLHITVEFPDQVVTLV
ncbi:MAG: XRE family transcriptional regulator [Candidatus Magasanikbacteria bacterium]|nr:XRE family transcriptional regulator [Candidatus Magasanikbacteria bacterium]